MFIQKNPSRSFISSKRGFSPGFTGSTPNYSGAMNSLVTQNFNLNANVNFGGRSEGNNNSNNNSGSGNSNNNGGGSNSRRGSGRPHRNSRSHQPFVPPTDPRLTNLEYSTNIVSGTLVNAFQHSDPDAHSTLFMLSGIFFPELSVEETIVKELMLGDIYNRYLTAALMVHQRNKRTFSEKNFLEYFAALIQALSYFYSIESVLAYTINPANRNTGLLHIRSTFDADILSQHEVLKNELATYPIPRNLLAFINFMHQNFIFSDTPNSPIFRLETGHMFRNIDSGNNGQAIREVIERLRANNEIVAIMKRAYPEMIVNELPASSPVPIHSKEFRTFWYNSCQSYYNPQSDSVHYSRKVNDTEHNVYYAHFCDGDIDGIFYACCSHYNRATDLVEPGIWKPYVNPNDENLIDSNLNGTIVAYDSGIRGFRMPSSLSTASQSGCYHGYYTNSEGKPDSFMLLDPSAQMVQSHDLENTRQAVNASLHHLLIP
jgi:hypothetical protein